MRFINARLGLRSSRLRSPAKPFELGVNAVLQRLLPLFLRVQVQLLGLQECAVISLHAERAILVSAIEFHHLVRDVLQEITVVADHHARECRVLQNGFEPLNPRKIQVVGGLVQEQNVRRLDQGLGNGKALAPTAGERRGVGVKIRKTSAPQRFGRT